LAKDESRRNGERVPMNMQVRETDVQVAAPAAPSREPSWRAKLLVALIVAVLVAAATYMTIRYFTLCGDCGGPPPVRQHDI